MWKKIKPYVISIAIAFAVGGLSSLLTKNNMEVYNTINRPALAPPMWLFPVVWSILFILMGISSALIWVKRDENREEAFSALRVYGLQLVVNFFWTIIFFNMQAFLFAFIWLMILWFTILLMIIKFYRIKPIAGLIQIPYLLWVTFAEYLNFAIYLLNK